MPEGHTLFRLARDQHRAFAGREVHVTSPQGRFASEAELVDGRVLDEVTSWGKHLFAAFGPDVVHVHLGLYGKYTTGTGLPPEPRGALRMRWEGPGDDGEGVWTDLRGATACELITDGEVQLILDRLGPDPLRRSDPEKAYARISRSRVTIGALLMDQAVLAGVGNVYRAELLFRARLDPHKPGKLVPRETLVALWDDWTYLLDIGVKTGQMMTMDDLSDEDYRNALAHRDDRHWVYHRTGKPCRVCGTPIVMELAAGRKLYYCPTDQT